MNTIGIDYQQTLSVVCLEEGRGASARVRNVGDGLRPLIPNAVQGDDLWGSRALSASGKTAAEPTDGPWLVEPEASLFWGHLYRRMVAFLGRIAPTSQNGYRVVCGLQAADYAVAVAGVERLCTQAGFGTPTCIPATDALLARYLAEQRGGERGESTLVVVVAGDTSTAVCTYRLRREAGSVPRVVARDSTSRHLPYGQAHWTGRLLINLTDLLAEPVRPGYELALRDAALEFGARLRRAPAGRAVAWGGPLRDKLYSPLQLTPEECSAWPEAAPVVQNLPDLIRDSVASVAGAGRPDLILVGGIGAAWPFAAQAAAFVGPVQQSASPEEDVARGAAWWPEVEALWDAALPTASGPALNTALPDWLVDLPLSTETGGLFQVAESSVFSTEDSPVLPPFELGPTTMSEEVAPARLETPVTSLAPETPASGKVAWYVLPEAERSVPTVPPVDVPPVKETPPLSPATPAVPTSTPRSDYDILPTNHAVVRQEEEEELDGLPPWDPRRDEL